MIGMTIAEDLLLLVYGDESGRQVVDGTTLDAGLSGALLVELALLRRVRLAGPAETARPTPSASTHGGRCRRSMRSSPAPAPETVPGARAPRFSKSSRADTR